MLLLFIALLCVNRVSYSLSSEMRSFAEYACLRQGGVCGNVEFCPVEYRLRGGCGPQRGVACCATTPIDPYDRRCGRRGGECTTLDCGLSIEEGSVCPFGQKCCIWLHK